MTARSDEQRQVQQHPDTPSFTHSSPLFEPERTSALQRGVLAPSGWQGQASDEQVQGCHSVDLPRLDLDVKL